jgi:hypothetical protein
MHIVFCSKLFVIANELLLSLILSEKRGHLDFEEVVRIQESYVYFAVQLRPLKAAAEKRIPSPPLMIPRLMKNSI